ncbi:hypothetical protein GQ53DRAFT_790080 [Thozetella sp. PMI_491]|nr:hypothetical protein GQ53DRAFT_790080 [Thozetella sp. PMI_491]
MASVTQANGCWTCLLRRKRCDGEQPICSSCSALEITCYNGPERPGWMDKGAEQRKMAQKIAVQIKQGSSGRRERRGLRSLDFVADAPDGANGFRASRTQLGIRSRGTTSLPPSAFRRSAHGKRDPSHGFGGHRWLTDTSSERELDLVMRYLDHCFPFMFPFYQPCLAGTSRAWLMLFITRTKMVLHSVMSLTSYFFTAALNEVVPREHRRCQRRAWYCAVREAQICFRAIQEDLESDRQCRVQLSLAEKAQVMENIVQLLVFEKLGGDSGSWEVHLVPALAIFEEIVQAASSLSGSMCDMNNILDLIGHRVKEADTASLSWTPDEAAFRFFASILLYIDIVASSALQQSPRLDSVGIDAKLDLSKFVGCENWLLVSVANITTLDTWKKETKHTGSLDVLELVSRAHEISQTIDEGLLRLDSQAPPYGPQAAATRLLSPLHNTDLPWCTRSLSDRPTRIWASAARIYLSVVVSGWQPFNTDIQQGVETTVALLRRVDCAAQMRALAWPMCIAGCLAEPGDEEQAFRNIISKVGNLQLYSALREASQIMETVWSKRETSDRGAWDIASCLNILGSPVIMSPRSRSYLVVLLPDGNSLLDRHSFDIRAELIESFLLRPVKENYQ